MEAVLSAWEQFADAGVPQNMSTQRDVLFLHATGFNAETYQPLLALLPPDISWDAWDLRGHGRNSLPADPALLTSWMIYADDVIARLDHKSGKKIILAGHSFGAVTAMLIAHKRPDMVRALLLIEPPLLAPRYHVYARLPGGISLLQRAVPIARNAGRRRRHFTDVAAARAAYAGRGAFRSWRPEFLEAYLRGGLRASPQGGVELCCAPAWEQANFTAFRHDSWRALRSLRCPVHLLVGEKNSTVAAQLGRFRKSAPHAHVEIVPGTTHFIPMEQPELVADRIVQLSRLDAHG
jgi:pimeloyl-ACP methyl ester carboxylesterase